MIDECHKICAEKESNVQDFLSKCKRKKYEDGWPEDKWTEEMEKHPFFMSKPLEEEQEMPPLVEALQQLKYDPDFNSSNELALSYKEDGNQNFKRKKYRWAVESYTKGLDAKSEDKQLNVILYTNRAAAQYYIGNYMKALRDVTEAKTLNPQHLKALHRGALCCFKLKEFKNCVSWCNEGLQVNAEDEELQNLKKTAICEKEKAELAEKEISQKDLKEKLELKRINKAILERGISICGKSLTLSSLQPLYQHLEGSVVHLTPENVLVWPVILLYPEFLQSDFIQAFNENTCFYDHLDVVFNEAAEWDTKKEYTPESVQVYFSDCNEVPVPVDKREPLKSIMCHERYLLTHGTLTFMITVANSEFDASFRIKSLKVS